MENLIFFHHHARMCVCVFGCFAKITYLSRENFECRRKKYYLAIFFVSHKIGFKKRTPWCTHTHKFHSINPNVICNFNSMSSAHSVCFWREWVCMSVHERAWASVSNLKCFHSNQLISWDRLSFRLNRNCVAVFVRVQILRLEAYFPINAANSMG